MDFTGSLLGGLLLAKVLHAIASSLLGPTLARPKDKEGRQVRAALFAHDKPRSVRGKGLRDQNKNANFHSAFRVAIQKVYRAMSNDIPERERPVS